MAVSKAHEIEMATKNSKEYVNFTYHYPNFYINLSNKINKKPNEYRYVCLFFKG